MALKEKTKKYLNKKCIESLSGKTIVVTGATSGVGLKAVEELLYLKANVIMAVRNTEKAEKIKNELLKEYSSNITIYSLDLASLDSIGRFVARIKRNKIDIYGFVNNAGVFKSDVKLTLDGYNLVMGTNYIGTYYLVERLLPYLMVLPHDVKLINTTSIIYKKGKINYNDFFFEKRKKGVFSVYGRSKLCITKYSIYLANSHMDSNVITIMTHPGITKTNLLLDMFKPWFMRIFKPLVNIFMKPEKGALAIPYALTNQIRSGSLIGPKGLFSGWGYPKLNKLKKKAYTDIEKLVRYTKSILNNKDM